MLQLRQTKRTIVQLLTFFVLSILAFLAYFAIATQLARGRAEAFCRALPVGTSVEAVQKAYESANPKHYLGLKAPDFYAVGFEGPTVDRWYCSLRTAHGRVAEQEIRLLD